MVIESGSRVTLPLRDREITNTEAFTDGGRTAELQDAPSGVPPRRPIDEEFRLFVESVQEYAIFLLDPEGRVATWNRGAERIKGYRADEIIGHHFSEFYTEEDIRSGKPARELRIASDVGRYEEEGWRVRKDGSLFWANVLITALRGPGGEVHGFGKVTRDLTQKKRAEETERELIREQAARTAAERAEARVRDSEDRYRQLSERLEIILEGIRDGITVQDRRGRLVFANGAAVLIHGFASVDAMVGRSPDELNEYVELLDEHGNPFPLDQLPGQLALSGADPKPILVRMRDRRTGREWWSLLRAGAVRDHQGVPDLVVSIWNDITMRRRQEEATVMLAEATALLSMSLDYEKTLNNLARTLVPRLSDWCGIDLVEGGQIRSVAIAHADPAKVIMARELRQKYPPDLTAARGVAGVVRTGRPELYPQISVALDDPHLPPDYRELLRALEVRSAMIVPLRVRERTLGTMTMVSSRMGRAYDEEDLTLAEELGRRAGIAIENALLYREAQRAVQLRDEFLSIAGHELKTPLTALDLQLQSLASAFNKGAVLHDTKRWVERLQKTIAQSKRLAHLIHELLDVSRITSGHLVLDRESVDLATLAQEVVERHASEIARAGSTTSFESKGNSSGHWDRSRIDQVMSNLLGNAIKYGSGKPIHIRVTGDEQRVVLSIEDHGIGVPVEHQDRIFQRFERAVSERNYGGFGLGLWIVREIVHAHGGTVGFESAPGSGSTFTVELPVSSSPAPS